MVAEGLPYFAFPEGMKKLLKQLLEMPPEQLRWVGFVSMLLGLFICYIAQRTGIFS